MNRQNETLPADDFQADPLPQDRKIKVYSEYSYVKEYLKHSRFEIVEESSDADILWLSKHLKDYKYDIMLKISFLGQKSSKINNYSLKG